MLRTDILAGESIQTSVPILMVAQAIRPIQVRPCYWCVFKRGTIGIDECFR